MKLEVGMYVRLQNDVEDIVIINRIANVFENTILTENDGSIYQGEYTKENVVKASYNIIDILEVEDFVSTITGKCAVIAGVYNDINNKKYLRLCNCIGEYYEDDIKSVITHEQMEQMTYKVGE